jgi:solute carrier family 25 (mitochondrial folate transporter), member 32
MLAGSASGALTALFTAPLDIARTRQQAFHSNQSLTSVLSEIVTRDGVRGLWQGVGPTVLGLVPTWAIYWVTYHGLKNYQVQSLNLDRNSPWLHLRCPSRCSASPL